VSSWRQAPTSELVNQSILPRRARVAPAAGLLLGWSAGGCAAGGWEVSHGGTGARRPRVAFGCHTCNGEGRKEERQAGRKRTHRHCDTALRPVTPLPVALRPVTPLLVSPLLVILLLDLSHLDLFSLAFALSFSLPIPSFFLIPSLSLLDRSLSGLLARLTHAFPCPPCLCASVRESKTSTHRATESTLLA